MLKPLSFIRPGYPDETQGVVLDVAHEVLFYVLFDYLHLDRLRPIRQ